LSVEWRPPERRPVAELLRPLPVMMNQGEKYTASSFTSSTERADKPGCRPEIVPRWDSRNRVAVLGLDGVPFPLLENLFDAGVMPRLAEVAEAGSFMPMRTTLPAVSSVAWTSFMTGTNPGEHGIFGFTDLKKGEIAVHLPSFDDVRQPALWNRIPGRKSVVVNLPFTYPARPMDGVLVAGFVAPIFDRAVYPPSLIPWLKSKNYRVDVDSVRGRQDPGFLVQDLFDTLNLREQVMMALMDSHPWDLFIGVITGTDRLHHFFFDAFADHSHRFHAEFLNYYRRVDAFIGAFVDRLRGKARLIVLSDHGFTRLKTQVYLNHILMSLGYLSYTRPDPRTVQDIHPRSRAFAMDPTRIYLHSRDRFRTGQLNQREKEELRQKLKHEMERIRLRDVGIRDAADGDPDEPLFDGVKFKEELYSGEAMESAPDLVLIPRRGYDVKAAVNVAAPTLTDIFTGMHTHDDAFLMVDDPSVAAQLGDAEISAVAGLIREVLRPKVG
jgi:predicted AlkP superfamily phosphohydrolase/phosphomutase